MRGDIEAELFGASSNSQGEDKDGNESAQRGGR